MNAMPNVEINLDLEAIAQICKAAQDAAWETMEGLRGQAKNAQVIPKRSGELEKSIAPPEQMIDGDEIHTALVQGGGDVPYARRLYMHPEYAFHQGKNKNAQGEWFQPWLPGGDLEGYVPETFAERLENKISSI